MYFWSWIYLKVVLEMLLSIDCYSGWVQIVWRDLEHHRVAVFHSHWHQLDFIRPVSLIFAFMTTTDEPIKKEWRSSCSSTIIIGAFGFLPSIPNLNSWSFWFFSPENWFALGDVVNLIWLPWKSACNQWSGSW